MKGESIVPIVQLIDQFEVVTNHPLPYCRERLGTYHDFAFQVVSEGMKACIASAIHRARPSKSTVMFAPFPINDANSLARAMLNAARHIAEPEEDWHSIEAAVTFATIYVLTEHHCSGGPLSENFLGYQYFWFDAQAVGLRNDAELVSTQEQLDRLVKEVTRIDDNFRAQMPNQKLFIFFPQDVDQLWLLRKDPANEDIQKRVLARLGEMHREDGAFLRDSRIINRLIASERAKMEIRNGRRQDFSKALTVLLRDLGLSQEVDIVIRHRGDEVPSLKQAKVCSVEVMIHPNLPDTFMIEISGIGASTTESMLASIIGLVKRPHGRSG